VAQDCRYISSGYERDLVVLSKISGMAKKRKAAGSCGGAFGNSSKVAKTGNAVSDPSTHQPDAAVASETTLASSSSSRVKSGAFCLKSSLGVPFMVVSNGRPGPLVGNVPCPTPEEFKELLALCGDIVKQWDSRGAAILADFEGEFTGLEGELVSACFQRTFAVDPKSSRPMAAGGTCLDMGFLIDLRCEEGVALTKRIMESEAMMKVIWGADGDVASLKYTPAPKPLDINSAHVVDAQLAFSTQEKRLGMAKMLERVPAKMLEKLPQKGSIDFDTLHARNCRALGLPLSVQDAAYAVDDLHRLDCILQTQKPATGTFSVAQSHTSSLNSLILHNIAAASLDKMRKQEAMLRRNTGVKKSSISVRIKRHLLALRFFAPSALSEFADLEDQVDRILFDEGVIIPADLSFCKA